MIAGPVLLHGSLCLSMAVPSCCWKRVGCRKDREEDRRGGRLAENFSHRGQTAGHNLKGTLLSYVKLTLASSIQQTKCCTSFQAAPPAGRPALPPPGHPPLGAAAKHGTTASFAAVILLKPAARPSREAARHPRTTDICHFAAAAAAGPPAGSWHLVLGSGLLRSQAACLPERQPPHSGGKRHGS